VTDELNVLLVEDEALNRALVRAIVSRAAGVSVALTEAGTIADAVAVLEQGHTDVLLLDVRLPDGSGLDLAAELRRRASDGTSPYAVPLIAILSASVLADERLAAETSGADAFLGKPFAPRELIALLERFDERIRARVTARLDPDPAEPRSS
jgi:CheY-like chemotaxis protein